MRQCVNSSFYTYTYKVDEQCYLSPDKAGVGDRLGIWKPAPISPVNTNHIEIFSNEQIRAHILKQKMYRIVVKFGLFYHMSGLYCCLMDEWTNWYVYIAIEIIFVEESLA